MARQGLTLYADYNRRDVHDIFAPKDNFSQGAGTWGIQGIIELSEKPEQLLKADRDDFVFFVTLGQKDGDSRFVEKVTDDGNIFWQSQHSMTLNSVAIGSFIRHDPSKNNIYLFLRAKKNNAYTYLGKLGYVWHDPTQEKPVYFRWRILDWEPTPEVLAHIGLNPVTEPGKLSSEYITHGDDIQESSSAPDLAADIEKFRAQLLEALKDKEIRARISAIIQEHQYGPQGSRQMPGVAEDLNAPEKAGDNDPEVVDGLDEPMLDWKEVGIFNQEDLLDVQTEWTEIEIISEMGVSIGQLTYLPTVKVRVIDDDEDKFWVLNNPSIKDTLEHHRLSNLGSLKGLLVYVRLNNLRYAEVATVNQTDQICVGCSERISIGDLIISKGPDEVYEVDCHEPDMALKGNGNLKPELPTNEPFDVKPLDVRRPNRLRQLWCIECNSVTGHYIVPETEDLWCNTCGSWWKP